MQKILVVGGAGYIGGALTDILSKDANVKFDVYDNLLYETLYQKPVNFIFGDVRDYDKLSKLADNYDTIIWLAALVGDGVCAINPSVTFDINHKSVEKIASIYAGKIIFTSTCSVYGAAIEHDLTEDSPTSPLSVYAESKLLAEDALLNRKYGQSVIFRLGTAYGLGDQFSRLRMDLVVNTLSQKAVVDGKLTVFGGNQWRPIISAKTIAQTLYLSATNNIWESLNGVYNLATENITILSLAKRIQELAHDTEIVTVNTKFEDQRNYNVSCNNLSGRVEIEDIYTLDTSIKDLLALFKSGRVKDLKDSRYINESFLKDKGVL